MRVQAPPIQTIVSRTGIKDQKFTQFFFPFRVKHLKLDLFLKSMESMLQNMFYLFKYQNFASTFVTYEMIIFVFFFFNGERFKLLKNRL